MISQFGFFQIRIIYRLSKNPMGTVQNDYTPRQLDPWQKEDPVGTSLQYGSIL